ncbi:hypothetical protein FRC07_000252 [Ceratobasidium sp. 392]|nr:hypothetical protein FRC07_000252 [Ceratobasidium sp. 392]
MSECVVQVMSADIPRRRRSRRQAPAHITLPPTPFSPPEPVSSPESFRHKYPATPGRSSATPASERPNPFFLLNEENPPLPVYKLSQPPKTPPPPRRPVLPPQVSLEHAFGVVRSTPAPGRKDDCTSGITGDDTACSPRASKARKELNVPSPILSHSSSRCSLVSEVRSQPEPSEVKKKKKSGRPRSRTLNSETTLKMLETPSFRSSAAGTPTGGTPRNISISEIPLFGYGEYGRPEDFFGLAAVQPPRLVPRRPNAARRQTLQVVPVISEKPGTELATLESARLSRKAVSCGSVGSRR